MIMTKLFRKLNLKANCKLQMKDVYGKKILKQSLIDQNIKRLGKRKTYDSTS